VLLRQLQPSTQTLTSHSHRRATAKMRRCAAADQQIYAFIQPMPQHWLSSRRPLANVVVLFCV